MIYDQTKYNVDLIAAQIRNLEPGETICIDCAAKQQDGGYFRVLKVTKKATVSRSSSYTKRPYKKPYRRYY